MNCHETNELLSLYIDRMLDESQAKEVEAHLSSCDSCRNEYIEMKEIIELLGQSEMVPIPDAFTMRLKNALAEEKHQRSSSGIMVKPARKKHHWQMITSAAAVFAVGLITLSLYSDVLGILPDRLKGGDQTGAPMENAELYDTNAENSADSGAAGNPNISSDGSVILKEKSDESLQTAMDMDSASDDEAQNFSYKRDTNDTALEKDASKNERTYGVAAGGTEPNAEAESGINADSMEADGVEQKAAAGSGENFGNFARNSKLAASLEECSRSLTSSGVERNAAAVQFYNNLIEERLEGFDYQILESRYAQTGQWQFRVFIFRGQDGNTYNEEILITGKDGEIKVTCSNKFMGF